MPVGINLLYCEAFAQRGGAALPLRRIVKRGFLRSVIVGDGEGHQLVEIDRFGAIVRQQARRDVR